MIMHCIVFDTSNQSIGTDWLYSAVIVRIQSSWYLEWTEL